jgi:hypothetical protein
MAAAADLNRIVGETERMIDGTLFQVKYLHERAQYHITSSTPVEDHEPLMISQWVERADATKYREKNWLQGHSIDSAAFHLGIEAIKPKISVLLRKIREGELIQAELETLDGFGSF